MTFPSESDYDEWNLLKKRIQCSNTFAPNFYEREVWWISHGINIGDEMYGKPPQYTRPILIIKNFNMRFFLGVPLSTKIKTNKYYVQITLNDKVESAIISQIRALSSKRLLVRIAELNDNDFQKVIKEIRDMLPHGISSGQKY